jgi:pimeloyl-ACP methyl ester carboxylesterase
VKRPFGIVVVVALLASLSACVPFPHQVDSSSPTGEDVAADLEPFYSQSLSWSSCESEMECATATAPLDWADPTGDDIELALIRSKATGSDRLGSVLVNPGGPGASGVDFVAQSADGGVTAAVHEHYDVVGFDPRGVGASTPISCYDDPAVLDEFLYGEENEDFETGSDEDLQADVDLMTEFGAACQTFSGELLKHVDTESVARDLDMLRAVLGDEKLNYVGYSYGTYIGATYAGLFPEKVGRLVLDGAVDPAASESEGTLNYVMGFESALRAYLAYCLAETDCPFTGTVEESMLTIKDLIDSLNESPISSDDPRDLTGGALTTAIVYPLYSEDSWPYLTQLFTDVMAGNADFAWLLADGYNDRDTETGEYLSNSVEAYFAVTCLDDSTVLSFEEVRADILELEAAAPLFGETYASTGCDGWPVSGTRVPALISATGADDILVVGTTNDPATPYAQAVALADELDSGHLITYNGEGHTAYNGGITCVDGAVDAYLIDGTVPAEDPNC